MFRALVVERDAGGATHAAVRTLEERDLPEAEVTVAVAHSTLNYKDALCMGSGGGMVRVWPHVPGIDLAGVVETSGLEESITVPAIFTQTWSVAR